MRFAFTNTYQASCSHTWHELAWNSIYSNKPPLKFSNSQKTSSPFAWVLPNGYRYDDVLPLIRKPSVGATIVWEWTEFVERLLHAEIIARSWASFTKWTFSGSVCAPFLPNYSSYRVLVPLIRKRREWPTTFISSCEVVALLLHIEIIARSWESLTSSTSVTTYFAKYRNLEHTTAP